MMHWVLQNNIFNEKAYDELVKVLERFNIPHSFHKVIPFIGELTPSFQSQCPIDNFNNVICMGSYSMRHTAKKEGWYPGVFDLEPYDFRQQLHHWGENMLNFDSVVCRFEDAHILTPAFIRPIHDSKVFAGRVFDPKEFKEWQKKVCVLEEDFGDSLTKDTLIQVCNPKKIYAEYRFWIGKQQPVTASLYKRGDKVIYSSDVDARVYGYVHEILQTKDRKVHNTLSHAKYGWNPQPAFCLDVADTPDGFKVVEINTINSSGFYAADIQKLVMALEENFNERN